MASGRDSVVTVVLTLLFVVVVTLFFGIGFMFSAEVARLETRIAQLERMTNENNGFAAVTKFDDNVEQLKARVESLEKRIPAPSIIAPDAIPLADGETDQVETASTCSLAEFEKWTNSETPLPIDKSSLERVLDIVTDLSENCANQNRKRVDVLGAQKARVEARIGALPAD